MDMSDDAKGLAPEWFDAASDVCGVVYDCRDAYTVANAFVRAGWSSRSSSWYGWEVAISWGEIELDPIEGRQILLNGVVDPARFDEVADLLRSFGLRYSLELYDDSDALVREVRG